MCGLRLFTSRLELAAPTVELAATELRDPSRLAKLLDVPQPFDWPPPLHDEESQRHFLSLLHRGEPCTAGWGLWFLICREPRGLVGKAGFKGPPTGESVEIGYSVLEAHQRNGYCTEALCALLHWAFAHEAVDTVVAHTLPALRPSIRMLAKCAFLPVAVGPVTGGARTIRYELRRADFKSATLPT